VILKIRGPESFMQSAKALSPISSNSTGNTSLPLSFVHPSKADSPIFLRLEGKIILFIW